MKILLVGAGGFASGYIKALLGEKGRNVKFEGVVDPYIDLAKEKQAIFDARIPVYNDMEAFYKEHSADLAIVCTPTYLHREHSICALRHGSFVLCEKPAAPTVSETLEMIDAEKTYGKWIAIGYQWSFSDAMQELKRDISMGILGKPKFLKTAISWPRDKAYYGRGTGWAGKISKDGRLVLDSIASNACAHYIHNMLFLLGKEADESAGITSFIADCYKANQIENFDTCSIRLITNDGVTLYFVASHATDKKRDPEFIYAFENATVTYSQSEGPLVKATFLDGSEKIYGDPFEDYFKKLSDCISAVKDGIRPICTVKTALPHVQLIEGIYNNFEITEFSNERKSYNEIKNAFFVEGLFEQIYKAYDSMAMLCDVMTD